MSALTEFSHSLRLIATATRYPLKMGAIWPSSPELTKVMADQVDSQIKGPIIELGSGTGRITKALIEHGIDESRLILIENQPDFYHDLSMLYPTAQCFCDDAFALQKIAERNDFPKVAAMISGLPLRMQNKTQRQNLVRTERYSSLCRGRPLFNSALGSIRLLLDRGSILSRERSKQYGKTYHPHASGFIAHLRIPVDLQARIWDAQPV